MLKNKIISWLVGFLKNSDEFNDLINKKNCYFYESNSLQIARIWGDKSRVKLGLSTQLNNATLNTISGNIYIGDYSFLGHGVSLITGTHNINKFDMERQSSTPNEGRDIVIGKGVWIASNATVAGPCEIGDYAVIGANSFITGIIESKSFYAGVPAKKIKSINGDDNDE